MLCILRPLSFPLDMSDFEHSLICHVSFSAFRNLKKRLWSNREASNCRHSKFLWRLFRSWETKLLCALNIPSGQIVSQWRLIPLVSSPFYLLILLLWYSFTNLFYCKVVLTKLYKTKGTRQPNSELLITGFEWKMKNFPPPHLKKNFNTEKGTEKAILAFFYLPFSFTYGLLTVNVTRNPWVLMVSWLVKLTSHSHQQDIQFKKMGWTQE